MNEAFDGAIFLTGPTATGKSGVAFELARRLNGEIISVDSMQVYRGLDVGTAKPASHERREIPHHLIDTVDLKESFDAARFVAMAGSAHAQILERGRLPIYCGGTGFYFKALFEGLGGSPPPDPLLRGKLEMTSLGTLLRELKEKDPLTYERIDRANPRRVVRAVEVIRLTGRPFSAQRAGWGARAPTPSGRRLFALSRSPADLRQRIETRVDRMFAEGLVEETSRLLEQGLASNRTAMQALGYRQVVEHLQALRGFAETVQLIKTRTWQFARRQLAWIRHQLQPHWIELRPDSETEEIAARIIHGESVEK
ncbi:MAG TPA: tRNA (adenosine(37)-N6)-dimethylallyltransferase MiaA [Verrucomicrobiales bacterium]|nr:tRNA (adenosine(37)-N6)-dimethylallyltransferase MiaA [Verrucomicrobiales bacterium]